MSSIILTLVVGGLVGWLGSLLMKTDGQMGILANIVVGIIGTSVGFWLAGNLGVAGGSVPVRWLIAVLGAVVLIFLLKLLKIFK